MSDDLFELGERIAELAARINIATFEMLTLVAEFDRREGWADNFASCAEWLAWRPGRTLAAARENVRVAHALEELPLTATAMKSGQLSYTKVRTMTRVATPETEATLLEYAQSTSAARLEWLARGWKTLSRDGELAAEEVRHRSRTFSVAIDAEGRMALDRDGKAAFFTREGGVLGGAPPLPEVTRQLPKPPPPPLNRLSNGAPRFVDSAVPLSLELAALEAVA